MLQLYKHNKGKWLLSTVVSKNTASNEEKWRSLRGRSVMCHWPTLRPKINHERGALWLRCGHPWSINPPPTPPSTFPCFTVSVSLPNIHIGWQQLNQHKWRDELLTFTAIFVLITGVLTPEAHLFWGVDLRKFTAWIESIYKPINCKFPLLMRNKMQNGPRRAEGSTVCRNLNSCGTLFVQHIAKHTTDPVPLF